MTEMEPPLWLALKQAEDLYHYRRYLLFQGDAVGQLRQALSDGRGGPMALRLLREHPVQLTMDLIDSVFPWTIASNDTVSLARDALGRLDPAWTKVALAPLIETRLARPEADWEDYRRIAELCRRLDMPEQLAKVLARAALSSDPDILEVVDDFS